MKTSIRTYFPKIVENKWDTIHGTLTNRHLTKIEKQPIIKGSIPIEDDVLNRGVFNSIEFRFSLVDTTYLINTKLSSKQCTEK